MPSPELARAYSSRPTPKSNGAGSIYAWDRRDRATVLLVASVAERVGTGRSKINSNAIESWVDDSRPWLPHQDHLTQRDAT